MKFNKITGRFENSLGEPVNPKNYIEQDKSNVEFKPALLGKPYREVYRKSKARELELLKNIKIDIKPLIYPVEPEEVTAPNLTLSFNEDLLKGVGSLLKTTRKDFVK